MFVGEAPGFYEDRQGEPFVGAAGRLLNELLESVGLSRADIYIANVIKCRPPDNRDPLPDEVETCKPFLFQQIELIKPMVVCTLGNYARPEGQPTGRPSHEGTERIPPKHLSAPLRPGVHVGGGLAGDGRPGASEGATLLSGAETPLPGHAS